MTKPDDARRKNLRRLLKADARELTIAADDLRWLLDEASRLQQGNDRLRRQNRRLRIRSGDAVDDAGEGDEAIDQSGAGAVGADQDADR